MSRRYQSLPSGPMPLGAYLLFYRQMVDWVKEQNKAEARKDLKKDVREALSWMSGPFRKSAPNSSGVRDFVHSLRTAVTGLPNVK